MGTAPFRWRTAFALVTFLSQAVNAQAQVTKNKTFAPRDGCLMF
jgi:hypothetical protein